MVRNLYIDSLCLFSLKETIEEILSLDDFKDICQTKMSFPDRAQRKTCWDSRDRYWECLDSHNIRDSSRIPKECTEIRKIFEKSCPPKWVTHFDRKRDYELFKEKMQKEGFEPIKET